MSNITIFGESSNLPAVRRESRLVDKISTGNSLRRIQTGNAGTFRRVVGGKQVGNAIPGHIDVIIVDMLSDISREYYAGAYNPDSKGSLPDCWANNGRTPEAQSSNRQADSCSSCPMNIEGSGDNGRKACRFRRRLAVLAAGDPSGDVYQLSFAAKSLFGDGVGKRHPFESYCNYLKSNGEGPDTVVTRVMYNPEAKVPTLLFEAVRYPTPDEDALIEAAMGKSEETGRYVRITAGEADGAPAPAKKPVPALEAPQSAAVIKNPFADDVDEEEAVVTEEPVKRVVKKQPEKKGFEENKDLAALIGDWVEDGVDADDLEA